MMWYTVRRDSRGSDGSAHTRTPKLERALTARSHRSLPALTLHSHVRTCVTLRMFCVRLSRISVTMGHLTKTAETRRPPTTIVCPSRSSEEETRVRRFGDESSVASVTATRPRRRAMGGALASAPVATFFKEAERRVGGGLELELPSWTLRRRSRRHTPCTRAHRAGSHTHTHTHTHARRHPHTPKPALGASPAGDGDVAPRHGRGEAGRRDPVGSLVCALPDGSRVHRRGWCSGVEA